MDEKFHAQEAQLCCPRNIQMGLGLVSSPALSSGSGDEVDRAVECLQLARLVGLRKIPWETLVCVEKGVEVTAQAT